jgi:hypothetical protein
MPYFTTAKPDQVVCILKAREPARIMTAIGRLLDANRTNSSNGSGLFLPVNIGIHSDDSARDLSDKTGTARVVFRAALQGRPASDLSRKFDGGFQ